jgi:hypothetical protein
VLRPTVRRLTEKINMLDKPPGWLELESIIPLRAPTRERDVERITSLSEDTIKRKSTSKI